MKKYRDIISGGVIFAASLILFIMTFFMRRLTVLSVGPEFMPRIVFGMMMVLGLVVAAEGLKNCRTAAADEALEPKPRNKTALLTLLLIMIYIACLKQIGFLITTAAYLFFQIMILAPKENRRPLQFLIIAVLSSSIIYYLFLNVFQLLLPAGILG